MIIRAIGPTLARNDIVDLLADPVLELHGPTGFTTIMNNNWRDTQEDEIEATGIPPTNDLESAIVATLDPGAYTAIVRGNGNTSGVALVEVYDLNQGADAKLANLSTRAFVSTGDNIVIAGFLLSGDAANGINGIGGPERRPSHRARHWAEPGSGHIPGQRRAGRSNAGAARRQWNAHHVE